MAREVKERRKGRGTTRVSVKNQVTLPVDALRRAGIGPGDELTVEHDGPGKLVLYRRRDLLLRHVGALTGVYPRGYLRKLRSEWR